ncbi:MAG: hypothetical protein ACTSV7_00600 [Candidatus Baldrarchaeia archaeon]
MGNKAQSKDGNSIRDGAKAWEEGQAIAAKREYFADAALLLTFTYD